MSDITKRVVNGFQLSDGSAATLIDDSSVNRDNTWSSYEIVNKIYPDFSQKGNNMVLSDAASKFPVQASLVGEDSSVENPSTLIHAKGNLLGWIDGYELLVKAGTGASLYTFSYKDSIITYSFNSKYSDSSSLQIIASRSSGIIGNALSTKLPPGTYSFYAKQIEISANSPEADLSNFDFGDCKIKIILDNEEEVDIASNGDSVTIDKWGSIENIFLTTSYNNLPDGLTVQLQVALERDTKKENYEYEPITLEKISLTNNSVETFSIYGDADLLFSENEKEFLIVGKRDLVKVINSLEKAILSLGSNV